MSVVAVVMCDHPGCQDRITSDYDNVNPQRWAWSEVEGKHYCPLHAKDAVA